MLDVPQIMSDWILVGQRVVSIMPCDSRRENVYLDVISPDIETTMNNQTDSAEFHRESKQLVDRSAIGNDRRWTTS